MFSFDYRARCSPLTFPGRCSLLIRHSVWRGLSLTLGSPMCKQCSNRYLSLLLVFPLGQAGIALVAVLTCMNLTVCVGTINGLILYANIIQAIHPVFFPSTSILSVFVTWMNLELKDAFSIILCYICFVYHCTCEQTDYSNHFHLWDSSILQKQPISAVPKGFFTSF